MSMTIKGTEELKKNLELFMQDMNKALGKTMFHGATLIQNDANSNHPDVPRQGKTRYTDRSGNLSQSIQATEPEISGMKIKVKTTALEEYAEHVEMKYPYMFPALEKYKYHIANGLINAVKAIKWVNRA